MTKQPKRNKSLDEMANKAASILELNNAPDSWDDSYRIGYSWGAYDGYKAGYRAGKRARRKK